MWSKDEIARGGQPMFLVQTPEGLALKYLGTDLLGPLEDRFKGSDSDD